MPRWEGDDPGGCYAMAMAVRLKAMGSPKYQNDGDPRTSGPGFAPTEHPDSLMIPVRWTKPRDIFVDSMSDLFHPKISTGFIAQVFAVMALAKQHTYKLLTKRAPRMRSLLSSEAFVEQVARAYMELPGRKSAFEWPLPQLWVGVSAENQEQADRRIPELLRTPAAIRWVSVEPQIGMVDLMAYLFLMGGSTAGPFRDWEGNIRIPGGGVGGQMLTSIPAGDLHWIVSGGESGPNARPAHPEWFRYMRALCEEAGVPWHLKQLGEFSPYGPDDWRTPDAWVERDTGRYVHTEAEVPDTGSWQAVWRVGKKAAGRVLDGETYDGQPERITA